jgi:hypothetical protein
VLSQVETFYFVLLADPQRNEPKAGDTKGHAAKVHLLRCPSGGGRAGPRQTPDRRLMLQCRGSAVTSDASLLAHRELEGALRLTVMAGEMLADARTGNNSGSRIARDVHINGNAVAPMRAAMATMSGSLCLK